MKSRSVLRENRFYANKKTSTHESACFQRSPRLCLPRLVQGMCVKAHGNALSDTLAELVIAALLLQASNDRGNVAGLELGEEVFILTSSH